MDPHDTSKRTWTSGSPSGLHRYPRATRRHLAALGAILPSLALCLAACDSTSGGGDGGGTSGGGDGGSTPGVGGGGANQSLSVTISGTDPRPVSPHFFGQNYWSWVKAWGNPVASTADFVSDMNLGMLRAGGANNETGEPEPFSLEEIDTFVAFSETIGAEPLLQISVIDDHEGEPATAESAAAVVEYVNDTQGYGIEYFSIGNEPDLYTEQGLAPSDYTAEDACTTFAEYAEAMRAVDPDIKILGPELSWKYTSGNDWLTPFLEGCGDSLDVVAVHRYPFAPDACTERAAYSDASSLRRAIQNLRGILEATGQGDKPLAITEANITWDGEPVKSIHPASPGTFPAGLWVADNLGVGLEEELYNLSFWSLSEGWTLGFFDGAEPRPAAHVLRLFATRFGTEVLDVTGATSEVSIYAGRDAERATTTLFLVNKSESSYDVTVNLTDLPRSDAPTITARPVSLTVAELADDGNEPVVTVYDSTMDAPE